MVKPQKFILGGGEIMKKYNKYEYIKMTGCPSEMEISLIICMNPIIRK